jgi:hypothetical protein
MFVMTGLLREHRLKQELGAAKIVIAIDMAIVLAVIAFTLACGRLL